ncbi:MAG: hypothetical protein NUW06_02990 [Candidatus Acetothermia bacterium]|nr:hypothetical protein [Candidatus Acetothermia bacterium]MDH7504841.1 hypothetical protein [Candidatus Acetothermia bacterium]
MRRRMLIALAAIVAIALFSTVAQAGVEGKFVFDFYVTPQTTTAQFSLIDVNFEGLLYLNITLSGLTMKTFTAFGAAGLETMILGFSTLLGPLAINDEFWFSVPYGGPNNCPQVCQEQQSVVYCWNACDPRLDEKLYFVKKRVQLDLTIGGITMGALVLFENPAFTYPYTGGIPVPEEFYFGVCLNVSGTTVSGIGIASSTGIYCNPAAKNTVKKYSKAGSVDLRNPWAETIKISNIPIGDLLFTSTTVFTGLDAIDETLSFSWSVAGLVIKGTFFMEDIFTLAFKSASLSIALDNISIVIADQNGNLQLDSGDLITISAAGIAIQAATVDATLEIVPAGGGLAGFSFGLTLPIPIGTFSGTVTYADHGAGLEWDTFDFALDADVAGLGVELTASFGVAGLDNFHVIVTVPFSA